MQQNGKRNISFFKYKKCSFQTQNLPTRGPLSFRVSLGFAKHLFMILRISRFATETKDY